MDRRISELRKQGYQLFTVRAGFSDGHSIPAGQRMMMRLAPAEIPDCVLAMASPDRPPELYYSRDVVRMEAAPRRAPVSMIGIGAAGMLAAAVTSSLTARSFGFELVVQFVDGSLLHLQTDSGAIPENALLRAQARLTGAERQPAPTPYLVLATQLLDRAIVEDIAQFEYDLPFERENELRSVAAHYLVDAVRDLDDWLAASVDYQVCRHEDGAPWHWLRLDEPLPPGYPATLAGHDLVRALVKVEVTATGPRQAAQQARDMIATADRAELRVLVVESDPDDHPQLRWYWPTFFDGHGQWLSGPGNTVVDL